MIYSCTASSCGSYQDKTQSDTSHYFRISPVVFLGLFLTAVFLRELLRGFKTINVQEFKGSLEKFVHIIKYIDVRTFTHVGIGPNF